MPSSAVAARPGNPSIGRLDAGLALLVVLLGVTTVGVWLDPAFQAVTGRRDLDVTINVAATLVGLAVAILAWVRWRETAEPVALYESGAFVALTIVNAITVGIVLSGHDVELGLSAERPSAAPVYVWVLTRLAAATLLVVGALRSLRRTPPRVPPLVVAVVPTIGLVLVGVVLLAASPVLPPVPAAQDLPPNLLRPDLGPASLALGLLQVVTAGLFLAAAWLYRRLYRRDRQVSSAFLAAGLVVAGFSQVHFALDPVVATGVITSADVLRLVFHAILFMGIQAELEADLGALRRANGELRRLRDVDAANAALAERARLAREIHDGLAQDLWYAKLKQGRVVQASELADDTRTTAREVLAAVDSSLAEARQAVMAMRGDPADAALPDVLRAFVDDFADRYGVRAVFSADGLESHLPARTEAELLRIVQEALNNVRKHADATVVRVAASQSDGRVRLSVVDNGRGFDPAAVPPDRYGLRGMRERAELVGARLNVVSREADGTTVTVEVPVAATGPGDAA